MKIASSTTALAAGVLLASAPLASGHSWIEYAKKLAKNGTMTGDVGYPRGYVPRNSTDPVYQDSIPQNILPISGQAFYSGDEILNKYKYTATPEYPMLEAAAGDYVAVMHLENGHTTLPQNQPKKPLNRGTIYFYGTSQPKDEEKLFDVHLLWNKDGSGGDKRGRLLATRNYDDGQCYQTNPGVLSTDRAAKYADKGAKHDEELACQSDIKLPDDLAEGSVYTVYWYWDWPDLNADVIDINGTSEGKFPWAGTFMRGDKDPNGFTMAAISRNESYSSVMDIKITGASAASFAAKDSVALDYVADQNIYSAGIEAQMRNNFQVDVNDGAATGTATGTGTGGVSFPAVTSTTAAAVVSSVVATASSATVETVTVTETVRPPASVTTVYVTVSADQPASTSDESLSTSTVTKTLMVTKPVTITRPVATTTAGNDVVEKPDSTSTSTMYLTYTTHINQPDDVESSTSTEYVTQTTRINQSAGSDTDEATTSTSTAYVTITTHIIPSQPTSFSTARSVVTSESIAGADITTTTTSTTPDLPGGSFQESDVSNAAEAIATPSSSTVPGRSFRETLLPDDDKAATTPSSASAVQTPYRRRANWALGDW